MYTYEIQCNNICAMDGGSFVLLLYILKPPKRSMLLHILVAAMSPYKTHFLILRS